MKKEDKKKSHNVYSMKDNYRIRIYCNDQKFYERQLVIPKLHYYSITETVQDILFRFIDKIGQNRTGETLNDYTERLLQQLNNAYMYATMIEELKGKIHE